MSTNSTNTLVNSSNEDGVIPSSLINDRDFKRMNCTTTTLQANVQSLHTLQKNLKRKATEIITEDTQETFLFSKSGSGAV